MFKKIEIWILYLVVLFGLLFTVGFGTLVRQELIGGTKAGWVSKTALDIATLPLNARQLFKILTGNNLKVEDRFPTQDGFEGMPNSQASFLLLSRHNGNLKEGVVELVDLTNFEVLHTWNPDIDYFNRSVSQEDFKYLDRDGNNQRRKLTHAKLTKDNGLVFTNGPLIKIDSCSKLVFQNTEDQFHHTIETDVDNNMWVPSVLYPYALPAKMVGTEPFRFNDDAIVKMNQYGKILYEKSVSEIFIENGLEYLLFSLGGRSGFNPDPLHLNDIQPVDSDGRYWNRGDVFLSLRHQSMVLLYRPSTNKIIWKSTGQYMHQHDIDILDDSRISVFNNNSKDFITKDTIDGHNEVIIYDFEIDEYSQYLQESLIQHDVKTITGGRSEILENNDLFVEETNYGRTLYFNSDGSLRWSHINRASNGNVYSVGFSRILYKSEDVLTVRNFLSSKGSCDE